jgi:uncharacterized membrane protein
MTIETLNTILVTLLIINFVFWIAFLLFVFFQIKKILKRVDLILEDANKLSSSIVGSVFKVGALALGLIKGFNTVRSITTLSDIFDDVSKEEKHVKKRK